MDARGVYGKLKDAIDFEDVKGCETQGDLNKILYAAAQVVYNDARKWCKAQVKEHTGRDVAITRLEPMGREERMKYIELRLDSALENGDEIPANLLGQYKDMLGLKGGGDGTAIESVDFSKAFPDLAEAVRICSQPMPEVAE